MFSNEAAIVNRNYNFCLIWYLFLGCQQ